MAILNKKSGFTLMEVMVVVILIGILSIAAVPYYKDHVERQKAALGINNLTMFTESVERYMALHNETLPPDLSFLDLDIDESKLGDENMSYNDGNFTYKIGNNAILADRNTGGYTLSFTLGDDGKLSCSSADSNFCSDKLNISCSES